MNVLILTPDAVGSTLLQRLITIYMQFHDYDRPVINVHELTNGLVRYHNATFDQEVLGKKSDSWGYYQSLEEIVSLLSTTDHYKTSRLAHYHIKNRQDSMADQVPFYQYLNDNFYIISCRRHNLFEHGLSWCLSKITKKLNVYTGDEKIQSFFELYRNGIDIDPNSLIQTLNAYRDYMAWCNNHFDVASYFVYEEHLPRIEQYILNLPIFGQQTKQLTWQDRFDISFDDWNKFHYLRSNIGGLALEQPQQFAQLANHSDSSRPGNNLVVSQNVTSAVTEYAWKNHKEFLNQHEQNYYSATRSIQTMMDSGVMISPPPIKKQTLAEKKHIVRNYQHLLDVYNQWIQQYPDLGQPLVNPDLDLFAQREQQQWRPGDSQTSALVQQKPD
jgi:hypothetical protein